MQTSERRFRVGLRVVKTGESAGELLKYGFFVPGIKLQLAS